MNGREKALCLLKGMIKMAEKNEKLSPMLAQYLKVRDEYKGYVLFFRLGDFYEMFFEDAENIQRNLSLPLPPERGYPCAECPIIP